MIWKQIWFIAQSDFKERTRKFSFSALGALSVLAAFLFVPDPNAEMTSITVDAAYFSQGTNWTWIPVASALCTGVLLPLAGFFYLRNALALDRRTGAVDLLRTSPVGRVTYLAGKYLSHIGILLCMLLVVTLSSFCMALLHFPHMEISVIHCFSYFISIIPGIFLCSAIALLTEAVPLFQSRSGAWLAGILYFIFYVVCLSSLFDDPPGIIVRLFDMTGFLWLKDGIDQSVYPVTGNSARVALIVYEDIMINHPKMQELFFKPLCFTPERILEKTGMIFCGILICIAASVILPRYEKTRKISAVSEKRYRKSNGHGFLVTEMILSFRHCSPIWFMVMSVLWLSMFFADVETAQGLLWILAIAWSCILFSDYGCREKKSNMNTLLPTIYHAYPRQLLIRFSAGGIISLLVSAPIILRTALTGNFSGTAAGIIFALFIPALSVFLGQVSASERMFELISLIICYAMLNTTSFIRLSVISEKAYLYDMVIAGMNLFMLIISCWLRIIREK